MKYGVQSEDYIMVIQCSDWTHYLKYQYEIHSQRFMNLRLGLSYMYINQIILPTKTVLPVICPVILEKTFKYIFGDNESNCIFSNNWQIYKL